MNLQATSQHRTAQQNTESPPRLATGAILFAAVMMMVVGVFQVLAGLVGLFANEFYVMTPNYLLQFDATIWGVIHLLVGAVVVVAGLALLSGKTWARVVGIGLVALSALANFASLPYYPFWSVTIIALDVVIIWALAVHGDEFKV